MFTMLNTRIPLQDMRFLLFDVFNYPSHYQNIEGSEEVTRDVIDSMLTEMAKFSETELVPYYASSDREGCTYNDGKVTTPKSFKKAYDTFIEGGWTSVSGDVNYGGQGLASSLSVLINEFNIVGNVSWSMYAGLTNSAIHAMEAYASPELKQAYLPKLLSGQWTGTMCLTEAHCGSDLGLLRTTAKCNGDGTFAISGTKIFISSGEHDLTDNIIHMVLAKLPDAPPGTKGISLFVVPKFLLNEEGEAGERNSLRCESIEEKMGIHGSSTCVMRFDNAVGYLVGEEHKGMRAMFVMMNDARICVGMQGTGIAEIGYQASLDYAKNRLQMRSIDGTKEKDKEADSLVTHLEVRRMLLLQKSLLEAGRALAYYTMQLNDKSERSTNEAEKEQARKFLGLMTPVCKAFLSETGYESVNNAVQIFGGHGFIQETGVEQLIRDSRIAIIYEGTTQIQALDLLGRKVAANGAADLELFIEHIRGELSQIKEASLKQYVDLLVDALDQWKSLTHHLLGEIGKDLRVLSSASVDYLMYAGYVLSGWFWLQSMQKASSDVVCGADANFLKQKVQTGAFYFLKVFPRKDMHHATIMTGHAVLAEADLSQF